MNSQFVIKNQHTMKFYVPKFILEYMHICLYLMLYQCIDKILDKSIIVYIFLKANIHIPLPSTSITPSVELRRFFSHHTLLFNCRTLCRTLHCSHKADRLPRPGLLCLTGHFCCGYSLLTPDTVVSWTSLQSPSATPLVATVHSSSFSATLCHGWICCPSSWQIDEESIDTVNHRKRSHCCIIRGTNN